MKTHILLRIASVITFLYAAGHHSGSPWTPGESQEATQVVTSMRSVSFEAAGAVRTYWDFYYGFGLIISALLLLKSVALWQMGGIAKKQPETVRPLMITFIVSFIINAVMSWQFFFALPAIFSLVIVTCLIIAVVISYRRHESGYTSPK